MSEFYKVLKQFVFELDQLYAAEIQQSLKFIQINILTKII